MNKSNPKIYVAVGDMLGCGYYRCVLPYKALSKYGFDITLTNKIGGALIEHQDVIVLQRQHKDTTLQSVNWYRQHKPEGKVVFEFDDNFHSIPKSNPASGLYYNGSEANKNMEKMLALSDLATVSTDHLAKEYQRFMTKPGAQIHACYNAIDPSILEDVNQTHSKVLRHSKEIRIGWAGSSTHVDDFKTIIKPLQYILETYPDVKFVFMGHDMRFLIAPKYQMQLEHFGDTFPKDKQGNGLQYSVDNSNPTVEYYKLLKKASIDIAVAPLMPYSFNASKSFIKVIEYGLAGIPFIATNFGPYRHFVNMAKEQGLKPVGLLADTDKDWKNAFIKLIESEELRTSLVENNYNNVINNHIITNRVQMWLDAYASIGITAGDNPGTYEEIIEKAPAIA